MKHPTVIVIGGGHNGLVCAYYLAKHGFHVKVLERRSIVGGAAVTESFAPGFKNSTASYTVSLLDPAVISDMNLQAHGLEILSQHPSTKVSWYHRLPSGLPPESC